MGDRHSLGRFDQLDRKFFCAKPVKYSISFLVVFSGFTREYIFIIGER
jgi:hypothetical protein